MSAHTPAQDEINDMLNGDCEVWTLEDGTKRLIAAAPVMLELLRKAHSRISDDYGIDDQLARDIYDVIIGTTMDAAR